MNTEKAGRSRRLIRPAFSLYPDFGNGLSSTAFRHVERSCELGGGLYVKSMVVQKNSFWTRLRLDLKRNIWKYIVILPVLVWLILFCYKPMYGVVIAFQNFKVSKGISGSTWVGFENFRRFFNDVYFWRLIRNTVSISVLSIVFSFPVPILLALMLNEVRKSWFKRTVQTLTYMPHFISTVVVCSLLHTFFGANGLFPELLESFGGTGRSLLGQSKYFYAIYIGSGIWAEAGWSSIIYLAALSGIDQQQYEAARVDGAGRFRQMWNITLPGIMPTVVMLLILKIGKVLSVGYEKIILLYEPLTYEVADVISTYVYRKGLIDADYSYSTAINLFNSVINIALLLTANRISKKAGQSGLF